LNPEIGVEEFLQSLWRNTLARYDSGSLREGMAQKTFTQRGIALVKSIYPEREQRRALYHTGLPPRDGSVLIERLPAIKSILQEAMDYATWDIPKRINHFARLIKTASGIQAFGVCDLRISSARIVWSDVLRWWMIPNSAYPGPKPNNVSSWYNFASKYFIYGLNWAIGAIIGSILERDGGEGQLLERWQQCELPWSVLWYKDMVRWGTLDPIASYALTEKEAYTRPVATDIAAEYWETVDEISDAALNPKRVAQWMRGRKEARSTSKEHQRLPQSSIPVNLIENFTGYTGTQLRVLAAIDEHRIDWYDPGGFLLARSLVPRNWQTLKVTETDFMLDPSSSIVTWQRYV